MVQDDLQETRTLFCTHTPPTFLVEIDDATGGKSIGVLPDEETSEMIVEDRSVGHHLS